MIAGRKMLPLYCSDFVLFVVFDVVNNFINPDEGTSSPGLYSVAMRCSPLFEL
jgi:hypothetical protein